MLESFVFPLLGTLLLNGPLALAGFWVARSGFKIRGGMPQGLAAFVLACTWALVGMELLGPLGFLGFGSLAGWSLLGLLTGAWLRFRKPNAEEAVPNDSIVRLAGSRMEWTAVVALGVTIWCVMVHGFDGLLHPVKVVSDGPIYHLYFAARWWKSERLFLIASPFGESGATYFPAVGDLIFAWQMVGWGGDQLARVGQLPFLLIAGLASYATGLRLGASRSSSMIATTWFLTILPLFVFSMVPNVDTILVAFYLLSTYFFLRYALRDDGRASLILGALALGGIFGTKPTGFVFGGLLFAGMVPVIALRRRGDSRRDRHRPGLPDGFPAGAGRILVWPEFLAHGQSALPTRNPSPGSGRGPGLVRTRRHEA